jgi:hypothetical protein
MQDRAYAVLQAREEIVTELLEASFYWSKNEAGESGMSAGPARMEQSGRTAQRGCALK